MSPPGRTEPPKQVDLRRRRLLQSAGLSLAALTLAGPRALAAAVASAPAIAAADSHRSQLILLGTAGGPTPKLNRSAPANAIVVNDAVYVIDCGNGVARQMVKASLDLGRIRDTFITHQHSDHNADYGNLLLLAWATDLHSVVNTWGPPPLKKMTRLFLELNAYDIHVRETSEGRPALKPLIVPHEISRAGPVMQDENIKVTAAVVHHPPVQPAFAYRFDCPDRAIVFSGDTRPTDSLAELAQGADILVHEVMDLKAISQVLANESMARKLRAHLEAAHTRMSEVGQAATRAGVKTLVLNHFVPGTPAIPDYVWYNAVKPHFKGRLIVGRDLMRL